MDSSAPSPRLKMCWAATSKERAYTIEHGRPFLEPPQLVGQWKGRPIRRGRPCYVATRLETHRRTVRIGIELRSAKRRDSSRRDKTLRQPGNSDVSRGHGVIRTWALLGMFVSLLPQAYAARQVSVAELEQVLASSQSLPDGELAAQLSDLQLTERFSFGADGALEGRPERREIAACTPGIGGPLRVPRPSGRRDSLPVQHPKSPNSAGSWG